MNSVNNLRVEVCLAGLLGAALVVGGGCSGGSLCAADGSAGEAGASSGALLPLGIGDRWTYGTTASDGTVSAKVESVVSQERVGGDGPSADAVGFKLVTGNKANDPNGDVDYLAVVAERVVRLRELKIDGKTGALKREYFWDPPRLLLDESAAHLAVGASWLEVYGENNHNWSPVPDGGVTDVFTPDGGVTMTEIRDLWTVLSVDESVTVPAGTFRSISLRLVGNSGASVKTLWYARGVGKVKQTEEGGTTEELTSYRLL